MSFKSKEYWMDLAEVTDAWRIFPRILVSSYGALIGYTTVQLQFWYERLPASDRSVEVTAFYGMLMGGLFGLAAYVFKVYSDGGYDWEAYHRRIQCQQSPPPSPPP
jgi:hypothetical protein